MPPGSPPSPSLPDFDAVDDADSKKLEAANSQTLVDTAKAKDRGGKSLMDNKMVPEVYADPDKHNCSQWARKIKSYCNGRRRGFRDAMRWAEMQEIVDDETLSTVK